MVAQMKFAVEESVCTDSWQTPPEGLCLKEGEVHVWRASLRQPAQLICSLSRTLDAEERARAGRFHFMKDRDHFIVARGLLRSILGRYLKTNPEELRFRYNAHGKPYLGAAEGMMGSTPRFNLSHSNELALFAFSREMDLGIDLEYLRPDFADEQVARRFFSPGEVVSLRALPPEMKTEGFFNCWTRKEAYVKARGEGLSLPLDQFEVALRPGEPAALLSTKEPQHGKSRWHMRHLSPGPSYIAALVVDGPYVQLKCWDWVDEERD